MQLASKVLCLSEERHSTRVASSSAIETRHYSHLRSDLQGAVRLRAMGRELSVCDSTSSAARAPSLTAQSPLPTAWPIALLARQAPDRRVGRVFAIRLTRRLESCEQGGRGAIVRVVQRQLGGQFASRSDILVFER